MASISACAVASFNISTWFHARAIILPPRTTTAPTGTSSCSNAFRARRSASFMNDSSVGCSIRLAIANTRVEIAYTAIALRRGELSCTMKTICALLAVCLLPFTAANGATEQEVVNQSARILRQFRNMPERGIPRSVLPNAKGLPILTVVKVGFGLSGKGGQGVVVARTGNGWSGPSFIGTGGAGWGLQIGAQITEFVIVLNTNLAVRAFAQDGNFTLGADASAAAGPVGREAAAAVMPTAAIYT